LTISPPQSAATVCVTLEPRVGNGSPKVGKASSAPPNPGKLPISGVVCGL